MVLAEIGYHVDSLDAGVAATRRLVTDPTLGSRAELWQRSLELVSQPDVA